SSSDRLRGALEAVMDGFQVLPMEQAAQVGDIFVTATGDKSVVTRDHILLMKDGAILANTGHFNVEIEIPALRSLATDTRTLRQYVDEFTLEDGRRVYLIADGRLVNLSAAGGHPAPGRGMAWGERGAEGLYGAGGDRQGDRAPKARDDGSLDRPADGGAGEVPGFLGRGHVGL